MGFSFFSLSVCPSLNFFSALCAVFWVIWDSSGRLGWGLRFVVGLVGQQGEDTCRLQEHIGIWRIPGSSELLSVRQPPPSQSPGTPTRQTLHPLELSRAPCNKTYCLQEHEQYILKLFNPFKTKTKTSLILDYLEIAISRKVGEPRGPRRRVALVVGLRHHHGGGLHLRKFNLLHWNSSFECWRILAVEQRILLTPRLLYKIWSLPCFWDKDTFTTFADGDFCPKSALQDRGNKEMVLFLFLGFLSFDRVCVPFLSSETPALRTWRASYHSLRLLFPSSFATGFSLSLLPLSSSCLPPKPAILALDLPAKHHCPPHQVGSKGFRCCPLLSLCQAKQLLWLKRLVWAFFGGINM